MRGAIRFQVDELAPKFLDRPERFNDWYFTVHFTHGGKPCVAKFSITEGSLLGQASTTFVAWEPVQLKAEDDVVVLLPSGRDIRFSQEGKPLKVSQSSDVVRVEMGHLVAICRPDEQRVIAGGGGVQADLTFTPRGPILHWEHGPGAVAQVTEVTRVSGSEALSDVKGTLTVEGETIPIQGRGLFEHVWFSALNFFEIRDMDWVYAHFDEMYFYLCHTESVNSQGCPFHFETGEMYITINDEFLTSERFEVMPEKWAFMQEARRFIPIEKTIVARTEVGTLRLYLRLQHYPMMAQSPMRLEGLTIDNIPGWSSLFYDAPVTLEGKFVYKDGREIPLRHGVGLNEVIRISPL